jgi:hypothetical protein
MIASVAEGEVIVGSNDGFVSYSTDAGDTWTKIVKQIGNTAAPVAMTATSLTGSTIYAALESSGAGIYRWEVGTSEAWTTIRSSTSSGYMATGIAMMEGALYVLTASSTDSIVYRSTGPHIPKDLVFFDQLASSAEFDREPSALKISGGSAKLWAIDSESSPDALYSYGDTMLGVSPTLIGPADGVSGDMNLISGAPHSVMFTWQKPGDEVTGYNLWIALDEKFDENISATGVGPAGGAIGGPTPVVSWNVAGGLFNPGTTYYWRVRVASPIRSGWSEVRSFTVEEATVTPPVVIEEQPPDEITIQPPEVIVNVPPVVEVPATQTITPAWIYVIIVIGAILVIAVIILIVRTRRAV